MSNFVVTNPAETQDAVNFLLTTKAPGVLSLSQAKKDTQQNVFFTPNGDTPQPYTYYNLAGFSLTGTLLNPIQPVLLSMSMTAWIEWDLASPPPTGYLDIYYEILRTDLATGIQDTANPVISYNEYIPDLSTWSNPGQKFTVLSTPNVIDTPGAVGRYQYDIVVYLSPEDASYVTFTFNYANDVTFTLLQVAV